MTLPSRILVTRTDRLGDVLLSLHALRAVRQALPESAIDFLVRTEFHALLAPLLSNWGIRLKKWPAELDSDYDAALVLFDEPSLSAPLRKKAPVRVGSYSKLRSFWSLTHGLRQRRSLGERNEGEYSLELSCFFLGLFNLRGLGFTEGLELPVSQESERARATLEQVGVGREDKYWVVHPGMGGSALNLSAKAYSTLLRALDSGDCGKLVLTMGPASSDRQLVEALTAQFPQWPVVPPVSLTVLAEVFRRAALVVAPSTGPLHLAHYVGAPTLGLFSPVRSQRARRWAPWGGTGASTVWAPEHTNCPAKSACLGPRCRHYSCLDQMVQSRLAQGVS